MFSSLFNVTGDDMRSVESLGYAIIENAINDTIVCDIHSEIVRLQSSGLMRPNRTHFTNPETNQHSLYDKPGIVSRRYLY